MAAADLTGLWTGSFAYPGGQGPATPFLARIEDHDGDLSGTTIEPNTILPGGDELHAFIRGSREGRSVDFTKTYDGAAEAAHSVDYVGRLSEDGNSVAGVWSLEYLDGTFEMHREIELEEERADETESVELDVPPLALPQP
jgi:hypothetical protein